MFKKSLTKMMVCDMAGTTIQENGIVYKTLYNSIKTFYPDFKNSDIDDFHGHRKEDVIKHFIKKPLLIERTNTLFNILLINNYKYNNISLIHPNLLNYFTYLRNNNIKIALNTGYNIEVQNMLIHKFNLNNYIDDYISSSEVKNSRPHPDMLNKLMIRNNILNPEQIIKVGDSKIDILEGKSINCKTVGVLSGSENKEELEKVNPDFIVDNVIDIKFN